MPPLLKTWLTLCLLLPLAAHATNREQRLPNGFTGYTTNASVRHAPTKQATLRARPSNAASSRGAPVAAMSPKQSSDVLSRAVNVLGTPYVWGGSSPKKASTAVAWSNTPSTMLPTSTYRVPPMPWPKATA